MFVTEKCDIDITSGGLISLPDHDPGTVNWPLIEGPSRFQEKFIDPDIITTGTMSTYHYESLPYPQKTQTTYYFQFDYEMLKLKAAADIGDESAFLSIQGKMDWQKRSPDDFIRGVQYALSAGAYLAARDLSTEGNEYYPDHDELKKYARILAPPKVISNDSSPKPELRTNQNWLMAHGSSFQGQWVAIFNGELLGSADSLKELVKQIGDTENILLTKVF